MTALRVHAFSVSLDGFGAGPNQSLAEPLGKGGEALHAWVVKTRSFHAMTGREGGTTGADDALAAEGFRNIGAWILGRNMFTHERGPWANHDWKGWWGEVPPYHCPAFVITHHPRPSFALADTTFHFVPDLATAWDAARAAAGDQRDVRLGGGVATLRQALGRGLVDSMHLAHAPVLLGRGESLFQGLDLLALGYRVAQSLAMPDALHVTYRRA
jgi:dihydrofolate reductase